MTDHKPRRGEARELRGNVFEEREWSRFSREKESYIKEKRRISKKGEFEGVVTKAEGARSEEKVCLMGRA